MNALRLSKELVVSPSKAFSEFEKPDAALAQSLAIYAVFVLAYAAYYATKPIDFPSMMAHSGLQKEGFFFWLKASLLGTLLYAAWFVVLGAFLNLAREGLMILKILVELLIVALSAAALAAFAKHVLPAAGLVVAWLGLGLAMWALWRSKPLPAKALLSLLLAVNLFSLISFVPLGIAARFRIEPAYMALQFAFLFWMMAVTTSGLKRLTGIALPRCFISLGLSFIVTIFFLFSLHLLGWIPKELLNASMAI